MFVVIAIDRLMDGNYDSWTFTFKTRTKLSTLDFTSAYGNNGNGSMLQAMADGPKLPTRASNVKTLQNSSLQ